MMAPLPASAPARQPLDAEEIQLLTACGFVAGGSRQAEKAERIFDALAVLRPTRAFAYIGLAMAYLNDGRPQDAVYVLEGAARWVAQGGDPDDEAQVAAFRGLALQFAGRRAESRRILRAAAAGGCDSEGARLARRLLGDECAVEL